MPKLKLHFQIEATTSFLFFIFFGKPGILNKDHIFAMPYFSMKIPKISSTY